MNLHPFPPERKVGVIYQVDGSVAEVTLFSATKLPRTHFGEYLGRGEVGEFLIVDVGGIGVFGRLVSVSASKSSIGVAGRTDSNTPVEGRLQLLSTLKLDGHTVRGIVKYPRVGDLVYAASANVVMAVIGATDLNSQPNLALGRLSVNDSVVVAVPLDRLFGRHLAIVGATGSGKSWTLGHIAESVGRLGGKILLIDATGEFQTLGKSAQHLAFGNVEDEPSGTKLVGIPHFMMRETDRNAFLNPSAGSQVPKLREAVRSLRLAEAISSDNNAKTDDKSIISDGLLNKSGTVIADYQGARSRYFEMIEHPQAPFNFRLLADQVMNECIWPTSKYDPRKFGGPNDGELSYVSSLVSRLNDLLQINEIMDVISPSTQQANALEEIDAWFEDKSSHILRISLRNLTFANHLREIVVNIIGQTLLSRARKSLFKNIPLVVAIDEAHHFFNVSVGDEFSSTTLNAFESIAKEGRKYGLTVCVATQRPADLPAGVLSQVGMTIVHRLSDGRDRQRVEQAAAELDHSATKLLPGLVPGEAVLMGVDFPVPISVRIQRPVAPPSSDGPRYSTGWTKASNV